MRSYFIYSAFLFVICGISTGCWNSGAGTKRVSREDGPTTIYGSNKAENNAAKTDEVNSVPKTLKGTGFVANLPKGFVEPNDDAGKLLLKEYGSVFIARGGATPPNTVVFRDGGDVAAFQSSLKTSVEKIGDFSLELQASAMESLMKAVSEAHASGLEIKPRDKDSAKRTYEETIGLWESRVDPALNHWVTEGKITQDQAKKIKSLTPYEQVPEVLKLEAQGIYFAKDLSKSIIYSVAPPGTSQHLSMLAFDCAEFENPKVREILAKHGWYQTVVSDLPHFTFLGVSEADLSGLGLRKTVSSGRPFWIPDL